MYELIILFFVVLHFKFYFIRKTLLKAEKELPKLSENFKCLLKLSESDTIIEIKIDDHYETSKGTFDMGIVRYKEANDHYEDYKAIGGDLSKKEFFEQFHDELEGMWEGLFGITLYSDEESGMGKTTNEHHQIVINKSFLEGREKQKSFFIQMLYTFAHEAYGHMYFKILNKKHSHTTERRKGFPGRNDELEEQIIDRSNEAIKHFDEHYDTYSKFL